MANIKITELNDIGSLASNDVLVAVDISADETHKITTSNLFRTLPDGTAAAPALAFSDDGNTGIFTPAENQLSFSTGGTQRLRIDSSGTVIISGNLQVDGATTTVQSTTVTIDDKNIELGSVASPSNTTADGGGITLKGATDKTIKWINSTGYWTFNTGIEVGGHLQIDDNNEIRVGTGQDLEIRHNASDSIIDNNTGNLFIRNLANDNDVNLQSDNGSGGVANYVKCDGSAGAVRLYHYGTEKLNTKSDGVDVIGEVQCDSLDVDGVADISGNLNLSGEIGLLGTTDENKFLDCRLGSNSFYIRGTSGGDSNHANLAQFIRGGAVVLFHNNNQKFATKSDGIDVTGEVQCDSLDVDGGINIDGGQFVFDAGNNRLNLADNVELRLGTGSDLRIYHNGSNTHLSNTTGGLFIDQNLDDGDIILRSDNGNGGMSNYIICDGSDGKVRLYYYGSEKLQTGTSGIDVTGEVQCDFLDVDGGVDIDGGQVFYDATNNLLRWADGARATFGASNDLQIKHDGANSIIDNNTGDLYLQTTGSGDDIVLQAADDIILQPQGSENGIQIIGNGSVRLAHNNDFKLETKSDGVDVNGEVQCDSLDVDGVADITGDVTLHGNLDLQDDDRLRIGSGNDLQLRHNGTDTHIQNDTGTLFLTNYANDKDITLRTDNSSGDVTNYIVCDGSDGKVRLYQYGSQKLETKSSGINVTGEAECDTLFVNAASGLGTTAGNSQDLAEFRISNSNASKLRIIEKRDANGTEWTSAYTRIQKTIDTTDQGYIQFNGSGQTYGIEIGTQGDEKFATFVRNGAAELYYDNSKKFVTKSDGVDIIGELQSDSLDVDGAVDITGNAILRSGIDTVGKDVYTNNGAFIANDADGAFSARSGSNIDHIWHNDSSNTWHFCSDTTYKNNGNSNLQGANVYINDLLIHAGDTNTHIGFPAADTFRVTTNSTERFRVTSTGALAFAGASNYGSAGQVLKSTGNGAPSWQDIGSVAVGGASAITMNDNVNINFGNSSDMKLFHDGTNSLLVNEVGAFTIRQNANDSDVVIKSDDGAGGIADYLRCDGSNGTVRFSYYGAEKAYTKSDGFDVVGELQCDSLDVDGGADITGNVTLHANLDLQDSDYILMGSGDDFKLYHNGSNSHIQNYTGGLYIDSHVTDGDIGLRADNSSGSITNYVLCDGSHGNVRLFHYGTEKFKTKSDGIDVQGEVQCDSLDVDGGADVSGSLNVSGNVAVGAELNMMGTSDNNKYLDVRLGSSAFHIRGTSGGDVNHETMAKFIRNAQVELYHNATKKFETTDYGALTSGELRCQVLKAFNATNSIGGVLLNTNGSIELHQADHVPFIDFKSSEAEDYDCRIQSSGADLIFQTGGNGSAVERLRIFNSGVLRNAATYNQTTSAGSNMHVSSDGTFYRSTSSIKYKKDVETIEDSYSDALLNARPVWYRAKESDGTYDPNWGYYGFIAEEIAEIDPRLVLWKTHEIGTDENNNQTTTKLEEPVAEGVQYERFVPHLLNLIKRQQDTIANLEARVAALEAS